MDRSSAPKPRLVVIVGPTASGKSELAVAIAKKHNGEVISADSRQIYRGLNVGSGKVAGRWLAPGFRGLTSKKFIYKGVPHHCIDCVPPKKIYTVADYAECARRAIADSVSRGKLPILAGGSAFWIDAVVRGLHIPAVPPNPRLRKKLARRSAEELFAALRKLDPRRALAIEQKNPRRLIRAIEIARALGKVPRLKKQSFYRALWLGVCPPPETLKKRIERRVQAMIQKGLVKETGRLLEERVSKKRIREFGFEYQRALEALEKKISARNLREALVAETLRYGRRQMAWFKRNGEILWVAKPHEAETSVQHWLYRSKLS